MLTDAGLIVADECNAESEASLVLVCSIRSVSSTGKHGRQPFQEFDGRVLLRTVKGEEEESNTFPQTTFLSRTFHGPEEVLSSWGGKPKVREGITTAPTRNRRL